MASNCGAPRAHYRYRHSPLPALAFKYGACTGTGISALWSVPVWAHSITRTGIPTWCPYWYWHFCTYVQYRYRHSPLPVLAFHCARTGIGILALWFSPSIGTYHYRYWCFVWPIPVLAFLHFCAVPVEAHSITGTGIQQWRLYWYGHFCTLVQYRYRHSPLPELAFKKWCPYQYCHFCTLVQYR